MKNSVSILALIIFAGVLNISLVERPLQEEWKAPDSVKSLKNPWEGKRSIKSGEKID